MAKLAASAYGDALFALSLEEGKMDSLLEEVKVLSEALCAGDDLALLMNHPKIAKEEKIQLIEDIFKGRVSMELVGLMCMLVEKEHYPELPAVFDHFINRVKEYKNIGTAYVTSAFALSGEQKKAVEKHLLKTTQYVDFEMHYSVNPALIGGMVIRIGDRIADGSVVTKLRNLTKELIQTQ